MRLFLSLFLYFVSSICFAKQPEERVPFSFAKRSLADIIDFLAAKKKINIVLPQGAAGQTIKQQEITFEPQGGTTLPLQEAWNLLTMFLELSGFSLVPNKKGPYKVVPTGKPGTPGVTREPLPLYVDSRIEQLPHSAQRIRYVAYLRNIKVPTAQELATHPFGKIFKDMLSPDAPVILNPQFNGFIIIDRADIIASLMTIIRRLDEAGFREAVEVIPITWVPVQSIVQVLDTLKRASGEEQGAYPFIGSQPQSSISHFASDTTIVGDTRTNSLILMGRRHNISRISDFVRDYIDVEPASGKSVLHTYDLQYLDAQTFAPALQNIVSHQTPEGQATQGPPSGGPEYYFTGVQVMAQGLVEVKPQFRTEEVTLETPYTGAEPSAIGITGQIGLGGNRLIVVARQNDWHFIKDFIKRVDTPQPQVIIEVVILDFTYNNETQVRSTVRSKASFGPSKEGFQFLASHITPVKDILGTTPAQLAHDLLAIFGPTGVPRTLPTGSLLISFNDPQAPGIWGLLQLLQRIVATKIISHPYLIITNNQKGSIESQEIRRFQGDITTTPDGSFTIPIDDVTSTVTLHIVPHISPTDRVRLEVDFSETDFKSAIQSNLTRNIRELHTVATLASGQILAIGGLFRLGETDTYTETPLLGRIPLLGAFFRGDTAITSRPTVAIFMSPIIIKPAFNKAATTFTLDKAQVTANDISEEPVETFKDPITRIYLRPKPTTSLVQSYLDDTANLPYHFLEETLHPIKQQSPVQFNKLKEMLAYEDTPLLGIQKSKSKGILNS